MRETLKGGLLQSMHWAARLIRPPSKYCLPSEPASRKFGLDRGMAIDRFYIQNFLESKKEFVTGDVLEVGDSRYTRMYGHDVRRTVVLGAEARGADSVDIDLSKPAECEGVQRVDCLIATQVLNFIFDVQSASRSMSMLVRPGGAALVTVAGCCQLSTYDADRWGDYWRFSAQSLQKILSADFSAVEVSSYGNYQSSIALLSGLAVEDVGSESLLTHDSAYPLLIAAFARR